MNPREISVRLHDIRAVLCERHAAARTGRVSLRTAGAVQVAGWRWRLIAPNSAFQMTKRGDER